jgi:DNA-directed RNA polymerase III subunit RPC8
MYVDSGEIVRVRIEADEFYDDEPGPPPKALEGVKVMREVRRAPYTITVCTTLYCILFLYSRCFKCTIADQGLGPVAWWKNAEVEPMDEG